MSKKVICIIAFTLLLLALFACERPAPDEVRQRQGLPPVSFAGDAGLGDALFHRQCATCHGARATGSAGGPPLVHKIYEPGHHPDLAFYRAIKSGVRSHHWSFGDMPPQAQVNPKNAAHIVAYVRAEQLKAGIR